ncbi:G-patch domain [Ostreococcus tauri]|uniref:G-patch domain n=1 Tax=Ostreococcus tauri TaxID=70448 RepID=A0A090M7H7_OSTTA|nr:G-patch domain [Ostreococcus tauri]CEF98642.1 G-patch domain [Ostreococcus tauri]|eukprot:XP_003080235.2 G-patch domain [Ostreococcus tauri]
MRVGGVEVIVDREGEGGDGAFSSVAFDYAGGASVDAGEVEGGGEKDGTSDDGWESSEGFSSESVDEDVAMDYASNVRRSRGEVGTSDEDEDDGDDEDDEDEDNNDESFERELRAIARMNVDGMPPDPETSDEEDEHKAMFSVGDDDEMDDEEDEEDDMDKWTRVIAASIEAGVSYIGLPPVKTSRDGPSLERALSIARAHGCDLEIRGGGKRRHAIIHMRPESTKKPRFNVPGSSRSTKTAKRQLPLKKSRRPKPAMQFVFGGVSKDSDVVVNYEEEDDPRKGSKVEALLNEEPVVYPNRGARRAAEHEQREREKLERARTKKKGVVVGAGHEYGAFEKHTTGFGSRMLAKMGFQGQGSGVGREGAGIAEPLTAMTRAKRVGLGAFGAER